MQICPYCGNDQNRDTAAFCTQCGGALPGIAPGLGTGQLPPQTVLHGRYVIVRRVGQGGMGAVYQVQDLHIPGKDWALKEMSDAALSNPTERASAVAAFQREAQLLATLRHPNLPQVIDYFTEGGRHYLVMDFIVGETLEELLKRAGPLPETQVLAWATQLCDVLDYLHNQPQPIIFRDLKPGNVMVMPNGQLKLIDFGIARFFKPGQQSDTQPIGTKGYAPPEQYGRGQTDARSDIYSLGVTLHEMLTGYDPTQTPFRFPPARQLNPTLSPHIEQVILRATETDPDRRFASAAEMRQALAGAISQPKTPPSAPPPPPPPPTSPSSSSPPQTTTTGRKPMSAATVTTVVIILCLTGVIGTWLILQPDLLSPTPTPTSGSRVAAMAPTTPATTPSPPASATPLPTPTRTSTPSPTPSRTATMTPSPTPTQTEDEAAIMAVIWRYVDLKDRAMGHWETDELNTVLRRGALSTQLGSVNWLRKNNSHWEYDLHSLTFEQFEHLSDTHVRVLVTKVETGRYYHQGSSTPSEKKSYYNYRYEIWYELEKIGEQWYITNIDL